MTEIDERTITLKPFISSDVTLNPKGARVEQLYLGGSLLWDKVTRGDGKETSTHPCTPIFGSETWTSFVLPQHGPMRNDEVRILTTQSAAIAIYDIHEGTYPNGISVYQQFSLDSNNFTIKTTHFNQGNEPAPVNFAEHAYWLTPKGWEGLMINGEDVTQLVKEDRILKWKDLNEILIPGVPRILLAQKGLPYANLWAGTNSKGLCDTHYVCIEPVEQDPTSSKGFGYKESLILPGHFRQNEFTIIV
ncbi:MAG: hypothetical protein ACD_30C00055G0006 [uncultured bacterium]|uniref:Aldose 1-epimerase n=4 Tax=Candidatus Daviesiibacteriota TaxID=1752718 RepID=A0A0G0EQM7_9BACT|nr:MAG: hypothetical protein ACD_30C00055G0006 [uncultured bacterium]KKQ09223.1 MAG: hypothetical protein US19_C0015G0016 [Candidatus Daviesbacteria bacterium GW2011_GWB1_36_5]KKQ14734.1 MAG: hypothetical protein US28_C0031G0017 [Candidatus Daviesbacteria bacterium GW2011_GWA1_36_8]OGE17064.1 MAG: hypothetical protein A2858_01530 [Candidatus Daviesbacteria bacterium RIFCSPHIGHO2_01_FULL_36_37]OGE32697.1 MAG: hypothetical protein A3C99_03235 [Candidatus Daviesbacteria bacterium RIFCSPHIGHO2_02_F